MTKTTNKSPYYQPSELGSMIGVGYKKTANFDEMYRQYKPEQLEELTGVLEETLQFLKYQKDLSSAFHKGQIEEVQCLLEKKKQGNLSYLRKDEGWLLRVSRKEQKPE